MNKWILYGLIEAILLTQITAFMTQTRTLFRANLYAKPQYGIFFDCDGVIVETEELHRVAYNQAFEEYGLILPSTSKQVEWDVEYYDKLQNTVGGGKPKMRYYFGKEKNEWPIVTKSSIPEIVPGDNSIAEPLRETLVDALQASKTRHYLENVATAIARPGVLSLMDEILEIKAGRVDRPYDIKVGICSASSREGFEKITEIVVGPERLKKMDVIIAGDDVSERKPHPMIYLMAAECVGIDPKRCVVIEDSTIGLQAAKGANMKCLITYTPSTAREDFYGMGADAKIKDLSNIRLRDILDGFDNLLASKRD